MRPSSGALLVVLGLVVLYLAVTGKLGAMWAAITGANTTAPNSVPAPGSGSSGIRPSSGAAGGGTGTGGNVLAAFPYTTAGLGMGLPGFNNPGTVPTGPTAPAGAFNEQTGMFGTPASQRLKSAGWVSV